MKIAMTCLVLFPSIAAIACGSSPQPENGAPDPSSGVGQVSSELSIGACPADKMIGTYTVDVPEVPYRGRNGTTTLLLEHWIGTLTIDHTSDATYSGTLDHEGSPRVAVHGTCYFGDATYPLYFDLDLSPSLDRVSKATVSCKYTDSWDALAYTTVPDPVRREGESRIALVKFKVTRN
jgi:hypothetical protein